MLQSLGKVRLYNNVLFLLSSFQCQSRCLKICLHAVACKRIDILKVNYIINILIIVTFLVSPGISLNNTFSEYVNFYTVQLQCMSKLLCDSACVNN
jgi:hypothetical protein